MYVYIFNIAVVISTDLALNITEPVEHDGIIKSMLQILFGTWESD